MTQTCAENTFTDTQRLDWLLDHSGVEFETGREQSCYAVAYLTSGSAYSGGVSGNFIAYGETRRACIDAFLRGEIVRID